MDTSGTVFTLGHSSGRLCAAHRWKVLSVGVAANASFSAAATGIPTTALWLRSDYHLDNAALGIVLGAMGLGAALSELPWGIAADRWGDRRVLLTGLVSTAMALLAMVLFVVPAHGAIPGLGWQAAAMAVVGLLGGSVNGASGRAVMRWFKEGERGLAMSIRQTAVPLGGGLGALMLPSLASHLGFRPVYGLLGLLCTASALLTWHWLHEPPEAGSEPRRMAGAAGMATAVSLAAPAFARATGPTNACAFAVATAPTCAPACALAIASTTASAPSVAPAVFASPLRDPMVWRVVCGIGILCAPQFAVVTFATVFLHDTAQIGIAGITATMVAIQLGAMVMRVWSGRFTDRHGNRPAYLRGSILVAVASFVALALAVTLSAPGWALMPIIAFAGICVSAWHGVAYTELATLAGKDRAGTALGMANTIVYLGLFLTPLSIPYLVAGGSWSLTWLIAAGCALLTYPLFPKPAEKARKAMQQAA